MRGAWRVIVAVPCLVATLTSIGACGGGDPDLSGTWKPTEYPPAYPETTFDPFISPRVSVEFRDDGTLTADDGCTDPYTATYQLSSDGDFEVGDLNDEEVACDGQVSWDEVFTATARVTVDGDTATFEDARGDTLVVLSKDS